ncbi:MAG: hypothetical protein ACOYOB_15445 [Myxococcota bacterium]
MRLSLFLFLATLPLLLTLGCDGDSGMHDMNDTLASDGVSAEDTDASASDAAVACTPICPVAQVCCPDPGGGASMCMSSCGM